MVVAQRENGHSRRMCDLENYHAIFQRQKLYKNFIIIAKLNKEIPRGPTLAKALRSIILKYPILACTVEATDYSDLSKSNFQHDYIKVIDLIKLDDLLLELPASILESDNLEEQCNMLNDITLPYGKENSLWKLAFLDERTIVYISNHCCADGMNGRYFMEDLVKELNSPILQDSLKSTDDDFVILDYLDDHLILPELPPGIQSVLDYTPTISFVFHFLRMKFLQKLLPYTQPEMIIKEDKHKPLYKIINISQEQLSQIRHNLRLHSSSISHITLTPYLQTVWLKALNDEFLSKRSKLGYSDFMVPGDARKYIKDPELKDQLRYGWCTSSIQQILSPVKNLSWNIIQKYNQNLKKAFINKEYLYWPGLMTLKFFFRFFNMDKFMTGMTLNAKRGGSCLSNLGLVENNQKDDNNFRIIDAYFSQTLNFSAYSFMINCVSTVDGGLNFVIVTEDNIVNPEEFEKIVGSFKSLILEFDSID